MESFVNKNTYFKQHLYSSYLLKISTLSFRKCIYNLENFDISQEERKCFEDTANNLKNNFSSAYTNLISK
jgi:hypothetical protein